MRILCISVHPVLEYDEIQLFESMGHEIFSLGFYFRRAKPNTVQLGGFPECRTALIKVFPHYHRTTNGAN